MDKYYLTTAIDYVNAPPHIGHAYEKIAADIIARYQRLAGKDVFFLTGVDEHGSKVEKTAQAEGKTPEQFVDAMAQNFELAWKKLLISHDYFIRTTEERHQKVVQTIFKKMLEKGDIYKGTYAGLYCEGCEDFYRERDLDDKGNCPNHKKPPTVYEQENYFFRLSKYKEALRKWLTSGPVVKPDGRRKEVLNQLDDEEFGDFSISRSRKSLNWGIPVPDDPDQVIYVWIDALTNYITGVGAYTDEKLWNRYWPADLHLIGKDIVKFHSLYWPAMLMAADIPLPKLVFGHGFITVEGQKMSKTLGNVLNPVELVDEYENGVDAVRYFLFAANSFDQDGDFSRADFLNTVNSHLANNLGNLLNRTQTLVAKNLDGKVPKGTINPASLKVAQEATANYHRFMESFEFAKAVEAVFSIVSEANVYLNDQKPWGMFKEGQTEAGAAVLLTSLELVKQAAVLLSPVTPLLSQKIWHQLGYDSELSKAKFADDDLAKQIPAGQVLRNEGPVFMRLEPKTDAQPAVP